MRTYSTQTVAVPPFQFWMLNGCAVNNGTLQISPSFVPSSPIAYASGYRNIGGYGNGYLSYADLALLGATVQVSADSPDVAINPVTMTAIGQLLWSVQLPALCTVTGYCSYDSGTTWHVMRNGSWWPGMVRNGTFAYSKVRFRFVMTSPQQGVTPTVSGLQGYITGFTLAQNAYSLPSSIVRCPPAPTGTQDDMFARLHAALPRGWFGDNPPNVNALQMGSAQAWAQVYSEICALHAQTRLQTATAPMLDIAAWDFYGPSLTRKPGETDGAFSFRIRQRVFSQVVTRSAIKTAVGAVTGTDPDIIETNRPADCGSYRVGGAGYTTGGHYGTTVAQTPYQAFVTVYRPQPAYTGLVGGYRSGMIGYSDTGAYADINQTIPQDGAIYDAINRVRPEGSTIWTRILNAPLTYGPVVPL